MITDWQMNPTQPAPATEPEQPQILADLLEEIERDEAEEQKQSAPRPLPERPTPLPFAFD
jgi:hypothetical protein